MLKRIVALEESAFIFEMNLLFIVLSLPILTIGANLSALFYAFMTKIDKQDPHLFKNYVSALKMNGKQATSLWLVFVAIGIILVGDFIYVRYFVTDAWRHVAWLFAGLLLYWLVLIIYGFALQSRFENRISTIFVNALMMSVIHIGPTFLMVMTLVVLCFCFIVVPFQTVLYGSVFLMVIGFAVIIYLASILMGMIFKFYMSDE